MVFVRRKNIASALGHSGFHGQPFQQRKLPRARFIATTKRIGEMHDRAAGDRLNALMRTQHILHEFSWRQLRQAGVASGMATNGDERVI